MEDFEIDLEEDQIEEVEESAEEPVDDEPQELLHVRIIADQVIAGEWGTGQERRLRLSQAGYDHRAVQAELLRRANNR